MNQNFFDHYDMCSNPPGKILPSQLGVPPSFFEIFSIPPAWQISEKSYPPAKVGGGTNYGTPTYPYWHQVIRKGLFRRKNDERSAGTFPTW